MLKEGGDEMIESLIAIFNRFEEEGQIPLQWRETSSSHYTKEADQKKKIRKAREVFSPQI